MRKQPAWHEARMRWRSGIRRLGATFLLAATVLANPGAADAQDPADDSVFEETRSPTAIDEAFGPGDGTTVSGLSEGQSVRRNLWDPGVDWERLRRETGLLVDRESLDKSFAFCHEAGVRLWHAERHHCRLKDEIAKRCPELTLACERPAIDDLGAEWDTAWLESLRGLGTALSWLLVVGAVTALAVVIGRNFLAGSPWRERGRSDRRRAAPEAPDLTPGTPAPADVLLARAEAAAKAERFAEAVSLTHAALLVGLDRGGLIRLHRSRTNGDYIRALRGNPEYQAGLRRSARETEAIQFGAARADREGFIRLFQQVTATLARLGPALLVLLLCSATGCEALRHHSADSPYGPLGHVLLERVLRNAGGEPIRRIRPLERVDPGTSLVVVIEDGLSDPEWKTLLDWVRAGGAVLVSGSPKALVDAVGEWPRASRCSAELRHASPGTAGARLYTARREAWNRSETTSAGPAGRLALVRCGADRDYLRSDLLGLGAVYALPDATWFENASLMAGDNAFVLAQIAEVHAGKIELIGPWTGSGAHNPFHALHRVGLTPWLLQTLAMLLAYGLWRGTHFGRPRDPSAPSRRAFSDHALALALWYQRLRASGFALSHYGQWVSDRVRQRSAVGPGEQDLAAALARRTGGNAAEIAGLLAQVRAVSHDSRNEREHLRLMHALERLAKETGV